MIENADTEIQYGMTIGRFKVLGQLGRGGMGVVYSAHDPQLDRKVALKVLRSAAATEEERTRMLREGQAMARVTHPNVITVYEVGVEGSLVFLAQELLDGGTLAQWLKSPHTQQEIIEKFVAAGRGLAAAHAAGLVHRDFKPENVLLGIDGRLRVADFGLARAVGVEDGSSLAAETRANAVRAQIEAASSPMDPMTRTGAVMGTPIFMAPEQHAGERADARSDQFAFCVGLYHALYGEWPFPGQTAAALAHAVIKGRMQEEPKGKRVPARLRQILVKGLATRPEDRYASIEALLAELTRPPSKSGRTVAIALASLVLVGGAGVGAYMLLLREPETKAPQLAAFDAKSLTSERGAAWLVSAIDRGQLDAAAEKYDMAAALAQQGSAAAAQTSVAWSSGALVLALGGHLDQAKAHLKDAATQQGQDATAKGYADLATAALQLGAGKLADAADKGAACGRALPPALGSVCLELRGDAAMERGDAATARKAYTDAIAAAKRAEPTRRPVRLELALANLDLDDGKAEAVTATAAALQEAAAEAGTEATEAKAWVLLARARLAQAASQQALDDLKHVKPAALERFALRLQHQIATGQAIALLGDPDEGLARIETARAEAERGGHPGLALEARLARAEVAITLAMPGAGEERGDLVADARQAGYIRIAHLAETIEQR